MDDILNGLANGRSKSGLVKEVPDAKSIDELFASLTKGGKKVDPGTYPGEVVELVDGSIVRRRPGSKSGGPTIDITKPDGTIIKVHQK